MLQEAPPFLCFSLCRLLQENNFILSKCKSSYFKSTSIAIALYYNYLIQLLLELQRKNNLLALLNTF